MFAFVTNSGIESGLQGILDRVREINADLFDSFSAIQGFALTICGLGALFYFFNRILPPMSRNEPIDFYPLLRPFAFALLIINFNGLYLGFTDMFKGLDTAMGQLIVMTGEKAEKESDALKKEIEKKEEEARRQRDDERRQQDLNIFKKFENMQQDVQTWFNNYFTTDYIFNMIESGIAWLLGWLAKYLGIIAYLVIIVLQQIYLLILGAFGPIAIALAMFPVFQSGLYAWLAKVISVGFYGFIAGILRCFINILRAAIDRQSYNLELTGEYEGGIQIIFSLVLIVAALAFFYVPTLADMIIDSGGGMGALGRGVNSGAKKIANKMMGR